MTSLWAALNTHGCRLTSPSEYSLYGDAHHLLHALRSGAIAVQIMIASLWGAFSTHGCRPTLSGESFLLAVQNSWLCKL